MTSSKRIAGITEAFAAISGVFFFTAAFASFGQNDFMYATAPIFWRTLPLYEDLMFVQTPGSIIIYGLIYKLVEPQNFFLALRFFSLAVLLTASCLAYATARALFGRSPAAVALIFLYTSHFLATAALDSGSVTLALLFFGVALYSYFSGPVDIRAGFLVGVSIGIAATMKLNFALYAIPFGLFIANRAGLRSRAMLACVVGGLIGSSAIWYYAVVDFDSFWFFNVRYHMLMNDHRTANGLNRGLTLVAGAVLFSLYATPLIYLLLRALQNGIPPTERRTLVELGLLFAVSLLAAFAPLYYAPQYMASPVFLLALFVAFAAKRLLYARRPFPHSVSRVAVLAAIGWVAAFWFYEFPSSLEALAWDRVPAVQMQGMRNRIDRLASTYLDGSPCKSTAISLSPIPLIGSSLEISPISASGQFLPTVTPEIERYAPDFFRYGLTPDSLEKARVTAFLVGYFRDIEAERVIRTYAHKNDFVAFDVGTLSAKNQPPPGRQMQLLLRRTCISGKASVTRRNAKNARRE